MSPQPASRKRRITGQAIALVNLLVALAFIIVLYSAIFRELMLLEGRHYSWVTSVYWTMQTMATLGYGDIAIDSDLGRVFSMIVLTTGVVVLFVLLPFMLIQFVYAPWLEARNAARTPRALPPETQGHVILTTYGPVEAALIERLRQFHLPYAVIVADTARALQLHDQGVRVMVGALDSVETYQRAQVGQASLVATTLPDTINATVILTVRQASDTVPIVATAEWETSTALFTRAGCQQVIQLGELLGREMARRVAGRSGGKTHVIGRLDSLLIAEAPVAGTSLVGLTVRDSRLRERFDLNVVGVWERGTYVPGTAELRITADMTLLVSGSQAALDAYDREIHATDRPAAFAVIIGGGRVGRATSRHLAAAGIEHKIIERNSERITDWSRYVIGDATDPDIMTSAGLDRATSVAITTHDDDVNVYLALYCRSMRDDVQILGRATLEQNVSTLHRAGADFVLSYVPMEATAIFEIVRRGNVLLLAEGLEVFTVPVPAPLVGQPLRDSRLRDDTGCNVFAVRKPGTPASHPDIAAPLESGMELVLIGNRDDEKRYFDKYGSPRT
jgi:Trk K+ transport system NAD-binding subunit